MEESYNKQLVSLLESYHDRRDAVECLQLIGEQEVRFPDSHPKKVIPLERVIETYQIRSKINSDLNDGIIKGYDTLLPSLRSADVQDVKIHSLELLARWYVIFTDEAVSRLFGLLDCPKKKAAWFNSQTGYD